MHPQISQTDPGGCPLCGMRLEMQKEEQEGHRPTRITTHAQMLQDFKRRFWISLLLTIPILLLSPMIRDLFALEAILSVRKDLYLLFLFSSVIFFYGGKPFLIGLYKELQAKSPGMMTLIGLAISTAYIYSSCVVFGFSGTFFFWELATLIDIMLLGHWIEMQSLLGAGRALEAMVQLLPSVAHKLEKGGVIREVRLEELVFGDRVLVKPGEKVPADGVVLEGKSSIDESMLTGESLPVRKEKKSLVIGGSVNGEGSLVVQIEKMGKESFLSQVIAMVKDAQASRSKTQDLANRAAVWLTLLAIGGGLFTFFTWLLFTDKEVGFAIERSVTVMVIACPHALGLAIPLVVAVSTALAAHGGLLIRNRIAFESARNMQAVVFDKTGTLTQGRFGITDILLFKNSQWAQEELLNYAGSLEVHSEHPIAQAIASKSSAHWRVEEFAAIPGIGAEGKIQGKKIKVVSPFYLREKNIKIDDALLAPWNVQGKTVVFVLIDDQVQGAIALSDLVREESKEAVFKLKKMGIQCMMLTGDNPLVGKWVADQLLLDDYFAEVRPQEKAEKIKKIQSRGITVAMVGDGVNDAPALAQADIGIAIGAGTDIAIEAADIILVKNNPLDVVDLISLAKSTYRKMVQNLFWAVGYNAIAIPLAAGALYHFDILLSPALGAVFMSVSTIICAINAKLLKIKKFPLQKPTHGILP